MSVLIEHGVEVTAQDLAASSGGSVVLVVCALRWQARKTWVMLALGLMIPLEPSRQLEAVVKIGAVFVAGVAMVFGARRFA